MSFLPDKHNRGLVMPAVLFITVFCVIFILLLAQRALQHSKAAVAITKSTRGATMAQGGVQLGLARLARRINYVPAVISSGAVPTNGTTLCSGALATGATYWMLDTDLQCYDLTSPGKFWTDNLSSTTLKAYGYTLLPDETDFSTGTAGATSGFSINSTSFSVTVTLFYAGSQMGTAGYNDIILRYGYEIVSIDSATQRTSHIRSYIADPTDTIQIHLKRPLSRYNLFAEQNISSATATPIYDATSYTGPVYSKFTYYQQGDPRFSSTVDISSVASPTCAHKTNASCAWKRPSGATFTVGQPQPPLELPGSLQENSQKGIAYWGYSGPPLPGGLAPGIYTATNTIVRSFGGVDIATVSVYINGDASICLQNQLPAGTTTIYFINTPPVTPPCQGAPPSCSTTGPYYPNSANICQYVWEWATPTLLIFVDGYLGVQGSVSNNSKVTLASHNNLVMKGSVTYASGGLPNATTVIGLISWEGNVLISKNMCPPICDPLLQAVIMAPLGGFGAEGYDDFVGNYPSGFMGTVQHTGAFIRKYSLPTLSSDLTKGWGLSTQYDSDLQNNKAPPYFPGNGHYQLQNPELVRIVDLFRFL